MAGELLEQESHFSLFWGVQTQISFCMSEVMAGNDREKKFDLWPSTLVGQIDQAQNGNLKMANLSWDLFHKSELPTLFLTTVINTSWNYAIPIKIPAFNKIFDDIFRC